MFFKVAFRQPKVMSPDIKNRLPEKRDTLCNTTWMFERIKMAAQPLLSNLEVHATYQCLGTGHYLAGGEGYYVWGGSQFF